MEAKMEYESYKHNLETSYAAFVEQVKSWYARRGDLPSLVGRLSEADMGALSREVAAVTLGEAAFLKELPSAVAAFRKEVSGLKAYFERPAPKAAAAFSVEETVKTGWLGLGRKTQAVVVEQQPPADTLAGDGNVAQLAFNQHRIMVQSVDNLLAEIKRAVLDQSELADEASYAVKQEVVSLNQSMRTTGPDRDREARRFFLEDMASVLADHSAALVLHARVLGGLSSKELVENPFDGSAG